MYSHLARMTETHVFSRRIQKGYILRSKDGATLVDPKGDNTNCLPQNTTIKSNRLFQHRIMQYTFTIICNIQLHLTTKSFHIFILFLFFKQNELSQSATSATAYGATNSLSVRTQHSPNPPKKGKFIDFLAEFQIFCIMFYPFIQSFSCTVLRLFTDRKFCAIIWCFGNTLF